MFLRRSRHLQYRSHRDLKQLNKNPAKLNRKGPAPIQLKNFTPSQSPVKFQLPPPSSPPPLPPSILNSLFTSKKERRKKTSSSTPLFPPLSPKAARKHSPKPLVTRLSPFVREKREGQ
ncbi:hypothetical protein L1987_06565 [Smallanthus sonchifolius]|uniref:Uncharacterized protein n=1 Tax=Smallanthus sonchifolius TaxID=185202 RepID=A0ACB9JYG6_9ASTR|nr:hypothetical protein L1987_06565 [Smallanthus sonchifolius]